VDGMYCIKEKIGPSRESEPKDFHENIVISGDLNSNLFTVNNNKLVDLMTTFNFRNVIVKPTRLNDLLDPIIISDTRTVIVFIGIHCLAMSKNNFVNSSTMSSTSFKKPIFSFQLISFILGESDTLKYKKQRNKVNNMKKKAKENLKVT
jgi:hypothetical protein